jgi:putative endonuclease
MSEYYIYIMTNTNNTVLYTGSTNDLYRRWTEHVTKSNPNSFTARYNVDKLVYYEEYQTAEEAIAREYQVKGGSRKKKLDLIKKSNPFWNDLSQSEFQWEIPQ